MVTSIRIEAIIEYLKTYTTIIMYALKYALGIEISHNAKLFNILHNKYIASKASRDATNRFMIFSRLAPVDRIKTPIIFAPHNVRRTAPDPESQHVSKV